VPPSGKLRKRNGACFSSSYRQKKQERKVHVRAWLRLHAISVDALGGYRMLGKTLRDGTVELR